MAEPEESKLGRPTSYTDEIGLEICERLANGESLRSICLDSHLPHKATVFRWLLSDNDLHDNFRDQYALAREIQYQSMADDLLDIADDGSNDWMDNNNPESPGYVINGEALGRSRLRVDTRKWFMSKVLPKFKDKEPEGGNSDIAAILAQLIASRPD